MSRRPDHMPLAVYMNGRRVGLLTKSPSGAVGFVYDETWLARDNAIPVSLSLPLREQAYAGAGVLAVFDNLLPDGINLRRRVAERTGAGGADAVSLLGAIGRDCVGALQFLPQDDDPPIVEPTRYEPLDDAGLTALIDGLAHAPLGVGRDREFRISLAGAQEKTALLRIDGQWCRPLGSTPTSHIIKPPIGRGRVMDLHNSVDNEWFCLTVLRNMGLPTAAAEIVRLGRHRVLAVERFDRRWLPDGRLIRLPQEDLCQTLGISPDQKYESEGGPGAVDCLKGLGVVDDPATDRRTFLSALIAFWLLGATDGHAKNFSLALFPQGRATLAPLYDVLSIQANVDAGEVPHKDFRLAMAVGTRRHYRVDQIRPHHFEQTVRASALGLPVALDALARIEGVAEAAMRSTMDALPKDLDRRLAEQIASGFMQRLGLLHAG